MKATVLKTPGCLVIMKSWFGHSKAWRGLRRQTTLSFAPWDEESGRKQCDSIFRPLLSEHSSGKGTDGIRGSALTRLGFL